MTPPWGAHKQLGTHRAGNQPRRSGWVGWPGGHSHSSPHIAALYWLLPGYTPLRLRSRSPSPPPPPHPTPTPPPQLHIYAPERGNADFGVVRAIARDSTDASINGTVPTYLDSDGCVSQDVTGRSGGATPSGQSCRPANTSLFQDEGDSPNWHLIA